jgi:hypothetical protein
MLDTTDNARLVLALSAGLGLIVAGVGNALVGSRRWTGQLSVGLVGVAAATGVAVLFDSTQTWQIVAVGGGLAGALSLSSSGRVRRVASALFRSPRVRWAAAAAVGIGVLGAESVRYDRAEAAALDAQMEDMVARITRPNGVPATGVAFRTDRGNRVTVLVTETPRTAEQLRRSESLTLNDLPSRTQVIHRGPPSDGCNCHGWVFTGGRYGVGGHDVDTILADNGYAVVTAPTAGDACVYRDDGGQVSHTAVVRAVCDDGTVLVEGKWGWMGVYLHPVQSSCYGQKFDFYRTSRGSHMLAIGSESQTEPARVTP